MSTGQAQEKQKDAFNRNGLEKRILETAIRLFNDQSYISVSIRDIANELSISPGNLTYYYKKKNDLIKAVFDLQYREYKGLNLSPPKDLRGLQEIFAKMIRHQGRYSFYFRNIVEIPRLYPELSHMQRRVFEDFRELFRNSLDNLCRQGLVKPETDRGVYDDLAFALLSVTLFWNQQKGLHRHIVPEDLIRVQWNILVPMLTPEGLEAYASL